MLESAPLVTEKLRIFLAIVAGYSFRIVISITVDVVYTRMFSLVEVIVGFLRLTSKCILLAGCVQEFHNAVSSVSTVNSYLWLTGCTCIYFALMTDNIIVAGTASL